MPGLQVVERDFGVLEVHADSQADVREAGRAMLMQPVLMSRCGSLRAS